MNPTALIAEDEPLLAASLKAELKAAWPELQIVATVGDGASAIQESLRLRPQVLFFDIRMPGMSGLDAALALADAWDDLPGPPQPFPALVFVTAYDEYAVQAFEAQAMDYVLKPVQAARLQKTVVKVRIALANTASPAIDFEATMAQLRALAAPVRSLAAPALKVIQASVGSTIHMVPVADVLLFEAADKYVRVLTASREYLIRTPLKELMDQLDADVFWQIHRGTLVRASCIAAANRDEAGKLWLQINGHAHKLPVSRLYAHLFKAM